MSSFASDNYAPAHPDVLAALAAASAGHEVAYGEDPWTARLQDVVRDRFGVTHTTLEVERWSECHEGGSASAIGHRIG